MYIRGGIILSFSHFNFEISAENKVYIYNHHAHQKTVITILLSLTCVIIHFFKSSFFNLHIDDISEMYIEIFFFTLNDLLNYSNDLLNYSNDLLNYSNDLMNYTFTFVFFVFLYLSMTSMIYISFDEFRLTFVFFR